MKKLLTVLFLVFLSSYSYSEETSVDQLYYENGIYYKDDSPTPFTGVVVSNYENGQLEYRGNFKDGNPHGLG